MTWIRRTEIQAARTPNMRFNSPRMNNHGVTLTTQAYIALSSAPKGKYGERTVSIARIRNYEIRMVESCPSDTADTFVFWIELFDHDIESTVDICRCRGIEDGVVGFEQFFERATRRNDRCRLKLAPDNSVCRAGWPGGD